MGSPQKICALYPGSFDPFTLGHLDIVTRASKIFDQVIIGIGASGVKKPFFNVDERIAMAQLATQNLSNIEVHAFKSLAVEFARKVKAQVILRGIRSELDYQYEMQLTFINKKLAPEIDIMFLPTKQELCEISSTYIKEIASYGGDLTGFLPQVLIPQITQRFLED